jgi:hypothetical protein
MLNEAQAALPVANAEAEAAKNSKEREPRGIVILGVARDHYEAHYESELQQRYKLQHRYDQRE